MKPIMAIPVLGIVAGCAGPRVVYDVISGPDESGAQKFQMSDSLLTFTFPSVGSGAGASADSTKMVVSSNPVSWSDRTYTVSGVSWARNWGTQTDVTVAHSSTSLLMTQLGAQVTDEVQTVATDAASVVQGALTLGATFGLFSGQPAPTPTPAANLQDQPPTGVLVSQFIQDAQDPAKLSCETQTPSNASHQPRDLKIVCKAVALNGGGKSDTTKSKLVPYLADIELDPVPQDAFRITQFPYYTKAMLYSACRSLTITVYDPVHKLPDGSYYPMVTATTLIADPTWFEAVAVPPNGHASLNSACGADTATGTYTPPDGLKDAAAIMTAVNNVASALKSKKSSGATKQ